MFCCPELLSTAVSQAFTSDKLCLCTVLLCFSHPCYCFSTKISAACCSARLLFHQIRQFQALFCKTTQALSRLSTEIDALIGLSTFQPCCTAGFKTGQCVTTCSLRPTQSCVYASRFFLWQTDTDPSPFFLVYGAILLFWLSFSEQGEKKRCRRSHQWASRIGAGAAAASLLIQDPVHPPPTTSVFDLLTAADGKDMSLEL